MAEGMVAREPGSISRRRVLIGTAWATPTIVLAVAVPQAAASEGDEPPLQQVQVGGPVLFLNGLQALTADPVEMRAFFAVEYQAWGWDGGGYPTTQDLAFDWQLDVYDGDSNLVGSKLSEAPEVLVWNEDLDVYGYYDEIPLGFPAPPTGTLRITLKPVIFMHVEGDTNYTYVATYLSGMESGLLEVPF